MSTSFWGNFASHHITITSGGRQYPDSLSCLNASCGVDNHFLYLDSLSSTDSIRLRHRSLSSTAIV
ncbi:MAG: hypothetical protein V3S69_05005 [Dehalococcoidales bacterium]